MADVVSIGLVSMVSTIAGVGIWAHLFVNITCTAYELEFEHIIQLLLPV